MARHSASDLAGGVGVVVSSSGMAKGYDGFAFNVVRRSCEPASDERWARMDAPKQPRARAVRMAGSGS